MIVASLLCGAYTAADALLDLNLWDAFERDHPGTFGTMYQFWARKRS